MIDLFSSPLILPTNINKCYYYLPNIIIVVTYPLQQLRKRNDGIMSSFFSQHEGVRCLKPCEPFGCIHVARAFDQTAGCSLISSSYYKLLSYRSLFVGLYLSTRASIPNAMLATFCLMRVERSALTQLQSSFRKTVSYLALSSCVACKVQDRYTVHHKPQLDSTTKNVAVAFPISLPGHF